MEHAGTLAPPLLMCGLGQSRGAPGFSCTDSWRVRGVTKGRGDKKIQLLASDLEPAFWEGESSYARLSGLPLTLGPFLPPMPPFFNLVRTPHTDKTLAKPSLLLTGR